MKKNYLSGTLAVLLTLSACEPLDTKLDVRPAPETSFTLEEIARLLSVLPIGPGQLEEVADAVADSRGNGYDEEYRMQDLFRSPGTGVGSEAVRSEGKSYERPLRTLIAEAVRQGSLTRGGAGDDAEALLDELASSSLQIYWPYSECWNGRERPVITFDPLDGSDVNVGYTLDGEKVFVDEKTAREHPVWVVNCNDDAAYRSLEMRRREDPSWGEGGTIVVRSDKEIRTLVLRTFCAKRNYDSWFAGASEFFVKCGAIEDFTASTEAELALYNPTISDFMIVVKRDQVGQEMDFNAVLVSEWSPQLDQVAFMIVEDDGGSQTTWKCSATVKYNSKAYGFDLQIPLNSRDDIVWRGHLSHRYIEKYSGIPSHFGDVDIVLELI
ncbi:MAG: hypothetical protein IKH49_07650 [Bacteroidales bacterium]|nr:hypothetical protein [Bacteroidales bacterium]